MFTRAPRKVIEKIISAKKILREVD